jgi:hypothetical protein
MPVTALNVTLYCCLCTNRSEYIVEMLPGWVHSDGGIDVERDGFCPDHAVIEEFASSQCPGCVGGWGDCPMWKAFAYSHRRDITEKDLAAIRSGVCPRRVNGTIGFNAGTGVIADIDLSNRAPRGGPEFAAAIEAYIKEYPA